MNKECGAVGYRGGMEAIYLAQMEMCRPHNVTDMRLKCLCAVRFDTQTHNLRGAGA